MNERIQEALNHCETGVITDSELINYLSKISVEIDPNAYVPKLSKKLKEGLMYSVAYPPKTIESFRLIGIHASQEGLEREKFKHFAGHWRMHAYFLRNAHEEFMTVIKKVEKKHNIIV